MTDSNPLIYSAIAQATADVGIAGVGKNGTNSFQKFQYRSIDDIRKALNPILAKNSLVITTQVIEQRDPVLGGKDGKEVTVWNTHEFTV